MFDIRARGQENEFMKYKHNHARYILNNTYVGLGWNSNIVIIFL